jgi:hypothetical protein
MSVPVPQWEFLLVTVLDIVAREEVPPPNVGIAVAQKGEAKGGWKKERKGEK